MPRKNRLPKKSLSYWFKKWLRKFRVDPNIQNNRFQKPPHDLIFLTSEEVKASLAKVSVRVADINSINSSLRPDTGILPEKNRLSGRNRKPKSFRKKVRQFFKRVSFRVFKKKHPVSSHRTHKQNKSNDDASEADAKFQKLSELRIKKETRKLPDPLTGTNHRHHHRRKQRHRNRFQKMISYVKRKLGLYRKKEA